MDDSLGAGSKDFLRDEDAEVQRFNQKPRINMQEGHSQFNGVSIRKLGYRSIKVLQTTKIDNLKDPVDRNGFPSMRALAQYVRVKTRPYICAPNHLIAPGSLLATAE